MTTYHYEAVNGRGDTVKGVLSAESEKAVRNKLREIELLPVWITTKANKSLLARLHAIEIGSKKPALNSLQLAIWTRQMASLLAAGLSVDKAIYSLIEESPSDAAKEMLSEVHTQLRSGVPLSSALGTQQLVFSGVYCSVIAAGEKTGSLDKVFDNLATELEASQALKQQVISAATYPVLVCAIAFCIVAFLMAYVLPQIANSLSSTKQALPLLTEMMLGLSEFMRSYWWAMFALIGLVVVGFKAAMRNPAFALVVHQNALRVPTLGTLIRDYNCARFSTTFGMLTTAGVPVLDALNSASLTVGNRAIRDDLEHVTALVREGAAIGAAMATRSTFPRLMGTFAKLGGETGRLGEMMRNVGAQLSTEVQRKAQQLASILEPALIVVMGGAVMLIVLAVMQPMMEMNSFI